MPDFVISYPDPPSSLKEAADRIATMINTTHYKSLEAAEKASNFARVGDHEEAKQWAGDAVDAGNRWEALVKAWEAVSGSPWSGGS